MVTRECQHCHGHQVLIRPRGDHAQAARCQCQRPCPLCGDAGFAFEEDERGYRTAVACGCHGLDRRVEHFNRARIPARYHDATFVSFQAPPASALSEARLHALNFAQSFTEGQRGILYYGDCGTGKTHLTVAILRHLIMYRGVPARFVEFVHLLWDLRVSFDTPGRTEQVMNPLVEVPVLAIDELGKGRGTEWELSVLDELISKRYNAGRTTLFTTNFYPRAAEGRDSLGDRVGERIFSRLQEMCEARHLAGKDFRQRFASG